METTAGTPERRAPKNAALGGEWVCLSGVEFLMPPLNFTALEEVGPMIPKLSGALDPENLKIFTVITHRALARAYPELTEDEVKGMLEFPRLQELMEVIARVNGLSRRSPEDAGKAEASPT